MLMENSTKKSGSVQIPKKKRSLDLKSLYEPRVSKGGESKKKVDDGNDQEDVKKKKRKSRKEVSLSCFVSDSKKSRKEGVNGAEEDLGSRQESSVESKGLQGLSLALGGNGSTFNIPKRPRGSVGMKKMGSDQVFESSQHFTYVDSVDLIGASKAKVLKSEDEGGPKDSIISAGNAGGLNSKSTVKFNGSSSKLKKKSDSKSTVNSSSSNAKLKPKDGNAEVKENKNCQSGLVRHALKDCNLTINNGDTSSKKLRSNIKKNNNSVADIDGDKCSTRKSEPSMGSSVSDSRITDFVDDDDDDEENLEQNAARMLSSRFDPSCTGFSSKRTSSVSQLDNGYSLRDSISQKGNSLGAGESASADDRNRALRPRREDIGKDLSRKRRHFYEILSKDLDAYWVIKQRIKIFWPLDETWYYGLVHDYNSESKLHHIKYDDRDEEWVDLREEKFKLLLLPNEVPGKSSPRKQFTGDKSLQVGQTVPPAEDASSIGNDPDSEPIASWLASKALSKSLKRRRTSQTHLSLVSSLLPEETDNSNRIVADPKRTRKWPVSESASDDNLVICGTRDQSMPETTSSSNNVKQVVYVRKKYHKKSERGSSVSRGVKAHGNAPCTVTPLYPVTFISPTAKEGNIKWSTNDKDHLTLNGVLVESKEFRLLIHLPVLLFLKFSCGEGHNGLLHDILMLQHGVVMTTSPAIILETLFIDTDLGLRFLLFEGCMKEALAFVFLILTVFSQSDKHWNGDTELPVTSIRFRLSSVQDLRKQHVFSFYSYSRLQASKQLYLDYKILQHCFLIKQLPVSECTYDNVKKLESEAFQQCKPHFGLELSPSEGFKNKCFPGILPIGVSREGWNSRMTQSVYNLPGEPGKVPQFALPSSAEPSFFLALHLQLLIGHSFACVNLQHQDAPGSSKNSQNGGQPDVECEQFELNSVAGQDGLVKHEIGLMETEASRSKGLPSSEQDLLTDVVLVSNVAEKAKSSAPTSITSPTSNPRSGTSSGGMTIVVPSFDQVDMPFDGRGFTSKQSSSVDVNTSNGFDHNTNSRSSSQRGRSSSIYSPLGNHSPASADTKLNLKPNGFSHGPKRPRTQVKYTLPFAGYDFSAKQEMQNQRSIPCKRIRRASLKSISDGSRDNQKKLELVACVANVLITHGDKGWRECGARIVLEGADHNEWRLAVKLSGVTKYSYKVKHMLQPGSTNRYSHAMMWKGGKDWVLEFPDRNQWMLFKEMHEECHNRNIRAASVKNIPIPGVKLIEENDEYGTEVPFIQNSLKYYRQVQTDVEMAMDHSHVLYDMDSDDEQWLMTNKSTGEHKCKEISEEFLEKTMDMFEKVSYVRHRDNFTDLEIEELVTGIGSVEAAKVVYEHWRRKRERNGMPLIRHLQPPLWERYQHQLKEWEHTVSRGNCAVPLGNQEKIRPPEKPQMFAFCLKPRGLDVPNKVSKQRSHRKLSVSGRHPSLGRRLNGHVFGGEKSLYTSSIHYANDISPSHQASRSVLSPRDVHFSLSNDVSEWNRNPKVYRDKTKKLGSYNQRTINNQQGISQWNTGLPALRNHHRNNGKWLEQLNGSDLHELRLRDASSAAKHARNVAKVKKERAQRLLCRADLAVHKAVAALMTADAVRDSYGKSNGDN